MEKKNKYIVKYRFRPFIFILGIILSILLFLLFLSSVARHETTVTLIILLFALLALIMSILQVIIYKKPYHYLIDFKDSLLYIDCGMKKAKIIPLSEIKTVAQNQSTVNHSTYYYIQFAVSPKTWCEFYNKQSKIGQYVKVYEEMYIVIVATNQKLNEINKLVNVISTFGISIVSFVPSVLGKYPGKPNPNSKTMDTSLNLNVLKKQRRNQIISFFGVVFIFFFQFCI